jgi:hypothetical protein
VRRERQQRRELKTNAGAIRNVIQHERLHTEIGQRGEVFDQPRLRRPDVVRRRDQHTGHRQLVQLCDAGAQVRRVIARHAHQHRQRVGSGEDGRQHRVLLGVIERRRLAGGTERDQTCDARVGIEANQLSQRGVIDSPVGERCNDRNPDTRKDRHDLTSNATVSIPFSNARKRAKAGR